MKKFFVFIGIVTALLSGCEKPKPQIRGLGVVGSVFTRDPLVFKIRLVEGGGWVYAQPEEIWDGEAAVGDSVLVSDYEGRLSAFGRKNPLLFLESKEAELEEAGKREYIPFLWRR